jgi:hypothetical protein
MQNGPLRSSTSFKPGHLFWMPAGSTWLNRDKPRPFALASPCAPHALGTLVYGSTQETEKMSGGACIQVQPASLGLHRNGLRSRTYFYPGTLLPIEHEDLPAHSGFLGRSLGELRAALVAALGIGRGTCLGPHAPPGSCRGRIVVLDPALAREIRTAHAVVLTEPKYSAQRNYQIILPIFAAFGREAEAAHDLLVTSRDWCAALPTTVSRILLSMPTAHSIWHSDDIAHETAHVVDDETLREIDRRLCESFSLPPAGAD